MQALTSPKKGFLRLGAGRFKREESDKSDEIWKLNTKIEQLKPAQLKGEVPTLHSEWSKLAKAQAKMDQLRQAKRPHSMASSMVSGVRLRGVNPSQC